MSLITESMFENVQFGIILNSKLVKNFKIDRFQYQPVIIRIFKRNPLALEYNILNISFVYSSCLVWSDGLIIKNKRIMSSKVKEVAFEDLRLGH